jgi:hypothetical protein
MPKLVCGWGGEFRFIIEVNDLGGCPFWGATVHCNFVKKIGSRKSTFNSIFLGIGGGSHRISSPITSIESYVEVYFLKCTLIIVGMFLTEIEGCVLQKSNKPYEKACGLDCYENYHN